MRHKSLPRISLCLSILILAGCGATGKPRTGGSVEPASPKGGYDFRKEGKVPASTGSTRPETDVEEIAVEDSSGLEVSEADAPPDTVRAPAATAEANADGFRIQLFASADRDVAENARAVAAGRLGMPAYMDLDGGVYKVKVGDFARREDANAALATVRSQYYPDAWIVPARIVAPKER